MARFIAQIVVLGGQIVGRAFAKALKQEFQSGAAARQAASGTKEGAKSAAANSKLGMTLQEAKQILNIQEVKQELVKKNYDHLFKVNDKAAGGSFYLQSKVVRAKERFDEEFREEIDNTKTQQSKDPEGDAT